MAPAGNFETLEIAIHYCCRSRGFYAGKNLAPGIDIHMSTQANTTNIESVRFWHRLGAKRINLAGELSLCEIKTVSNDSEIELEAFAHGAMCISYSGRCLLSSFMAMRDGNRGMCCHPCREVIPGMVDSDGEKPDLAQPGSVLTMSFNSKCFANELLRRISPHGG